MESGTVGYSDSTKLTMKDEVKQSAEHVINGLSNGINNKSEGHHKHKHKDKDKDRDKHSDKHKHKDKDRDKDRHSSSKEKNKDSSSDKKHKEDQKEKDHRDKSKNKERKEHRDKEKESKDKVKIKEHSDKNKENRDKEFKDKHKDLNEKDKHKVHYEKEKHKDQKSHESKSKDHKSSSSSSNTSKSHSSSSSSTKNKDKDLSSSAGNSSGSKNKHSFDKHREKNSDQNEKRSGSSKSSDKTLEKSSRVDSDRSEKQRISESNNVKKDAIKKIKTEFISVKDEPFDDDNEVQSGKLNYTSDSISMNTSHIKEEINYSNIESENSALYDSEEPRNHSENWARSSVKEEPESEEDVPLSKRTYNNKRKSQDSDNEEDVPLSARKKIKKESIKKRKKESYSDYEEYSEDDKKLKKSKPKIKKEEKPKSQETVSPTKRKKKNEEEEQNVWKWWEEEKKDDGVKWKFLEHKGPMFAPPYEPLPSNIKFYYNGKEMKLSENAEEIATFYARMIEHDYTTKDIFNTNFFKDWRKSMTSEEKEIITDLKKCNFKKIHEYFVQKSEEKKAMSKEEKKKIKEEAEEIAKDYGFCIIDGHKEKIGNFKIEPPGLFRGRGEHPKMGKLKKRVMPEDVIINCSKDSKYPVPPKGHKWKEVRHDNTVTWLASWTENVQGQVKYVMLNPSSKLKGEKDWQKYEIARKLAKFIDKIREDYREDWKSKEMRIRQRAVAMYFIDKLALRAGNEKDEDQADTVGCCSLRVEHIQLHEEKDGKEYVVEFDFLGKDSIRYQNEVPVEKRVFKNLQLFCESKKGSDDLFDRLNTSVLNKHLNELMEGLTAKVFRTYNASITLQNQLNELTDPNAFLPEKILQYNRANRAVAILCNHQRSVPKSHEKSMGNLKQKIETKKEQIAEAQKQYKEAKRDAKDGSNHTKIVLEKKKKALDRLKDQLTKLEVQETDKEENKTIALSTSKLNYLDPRISVAWCKKYDVPIERVYNKTQRSKFRWAIDMAGPDYIF